MDPMTAMTLANVLKSATSENSCSLHPGAGSMLSWMQQPSLSVAPAPALPTPGVA